MSEIGLERPRRYEVFQRQDGRAETPIRITGLSEPAARVVILGAGGRIAARQDLPVAKGIAEGSVWMPQGGWYTVAVRQRGRRVRLGQFGVGDVLVIAGQSNAAGHGDGFVADRTGMVSVWTESGEWIPATQPEGMPGGMGAGSPWPMLGELMHLSERVPIGFINAAVGSSSTEQWQPDGPSTGSGSPHDAGEGPSRAQSRGGDLYAGLKRALSGRRVRAVLWHQGESDQVSGFTTEQTYDNMTAIINQSRQDAGWEVPWYVALASHTPDASEEARERTRSAQKALYKMGLALPGPDTDTYVPESMRYDHLHFGQVGLEVHAILWFRALHFAGR